MIMSQRVHRLGEFVRAAALLGALVSAGERVGAFVGAHRPEWHRVGGFVAAHRPGWHRTSTPHVALAAGYASTVVWASPVGYSLVGVAYIVTVVFEVRETHRVKSTHACLATAYVATVVLYPLLHAAGIGLVGAAYAYSAWQEGEKRG